MFCWRGVLKTFYFLHKPEERLTGCGYDQWHSVQTSQLGTRPLTLDVVHVFDTWLNLKSGVSQGKGRFGISQAQVVMVSKLLIIFFFIFLRGEKTNFWFLGMHMMSGIFEHIHHCLNSWVRWECCYSSNSQRPSLNTWARL